MQVIQSFLNTAAATQIVFQRPARGNLSRLYWSRS